MSDKLEIRNFNIREARWQVDNKVLSNIRRIVFIVEQKVPQEEEWDGKDEDSYHWLATDKDDNPIGTARLLLDGQIGRMAVLSEHRKFGVGAALLEAAVNKARHLGMESVYLNAQTHALGFYERCGFTAEGEEFMEAGIPHQRMTQTLTSLEDNIQRVVTAPPEFDLDVKPFDTGEVAWTDVSREIGRVRRQVFETELKLADFPIDADDDDTAIHWAAENKDGHIVGVIRMTPQGEVSRLAVIDDYRGQGIGLSLMELTVQRARRYGFTEITATAPPSGSDFLKKFGFEEDDSGTWRFTIEEEDTDLMTRDDKGKAHSDDVLYELGVDAQLILLRSESDFRNVILELARQARQSIRIYSPVLSHDLFNTQELADVCSELARRNKYTKIEILVFDPHRIIKNGHVLLNLARRLPSSVGIKVVDPEMRQQNHEYMVVDGQGMFYRQEHDVYEGVAYFYNITECNRLTRQFSYSWESGLLDPNLRQLRI